MPSPGERTTHRRRLLAVATVLLATIGAACSHNDDDAGRTVVEVFGPIVGEPGQRLGQALREVSADSAVELRYVGVTSFNEQLEDRLASGDRPGIALLPQPGLLDELATRGILQPLPTDVADASRDQFPPRLVDLVTIDEQPAAVWLTVDIKSLIWYRPSAFRERGLEIPTTLDELADLSERIRTSEDGVAPWCLTMEAGASSGWVGTDWVEDYTIRRLGPDRYDQWTDGSLPFDSQPITGVFDELADLLRRPGAVDGGTRAVLTTPWERSANLLLEQPATCIMAHQADFLRREFPSGTRIGPDGDIDFFVLPAVDTTPPPLLLGGTLAVPLVGGHSVEAAMRLIASPELAEQLDQTSDFLSPHLDVDRQTVTDATSNRLLDLLAGTPEVRFDGSDLMPPAVGTGTFWTGMRSFFAGDDIGPVLGDIQAGWSVTQSD